MLVSLISLPRQEFVFFISSSFGFVLVVAASRRQPAPPLPSHLFVTYLDAEHAVEGPAAHARAAEVQVPQLALAARPDAAPVAGAARSRRATAATAAG